MPLSSDRSFARIHIHFVRHPGTIASHAANPGTNADIMRVDTSPRGVEIPTSQADFLIGRGSYVEPVPPREDTISHPRSRGR